MPEIDAIKAAGYICIRITPTIWRARGPYGTVDIYPYQRLYRRYGTPAPYTNAVVLVRSLIEPYELPTAAQVEAEQAWRVGLEKLYRTLSPHAHCGSRTID